ncbi:hypothetical protein F5B21DRAFT_499589 [Xylaria acuta]|nr:hypothetical protein F5B21DRAFT_499589 [Xylaria acuta]
MLFSIGRSATRRLASTNFATSLGRSVVFRAATKSHFNAPGIYIPSSQAIRGFASAGRPKKVSTSKSAETTSAKKPAKKPATKKLAKKPAIKKTKAKAKPKPKPKPTPKRAKRPVSEERKTMLERQSLKRTALFAEPNSLPTHVYQAFVVEKTQGKTDGRAVVNVMASVGRDFKALPSHEMERLKSVVGQNKLTNAATYKAWVESHSVQEIYDANLARKALKRKYRFPKKSVKLIRDDRIPKKPTTAFGLFTKARWASGDYSSGGAPISEIASKIANQWKGLTAAERKPYEDLARSQVEHYEKETNAVLVRKRSKRTKSPSP